MNSKNVLSPAAGLRQRPLAACIAALCLVSGVAVADAAGLPALSNAAPMSGLSIALRADTLVEAGRAPAAIVVDNCNDSGPGSLRDAVAAAASGDAIDLTQLGCSTISLTTGAIVFGQAQLALEGPGRDALTLDAGPSSGASALYHLGSGSLIVRDMSIINGSKYRSDVQARGGCIHSEGNVLLIESRVADCSANSSGAEGALGGAIFSQGATYLRDSSVTGSEAHARGFGYASGGGIYSLGGLTAMYSTISENASIGESQTPSFGGGALSWGAVFVLGSEISANQATRMGGLALYATDGSVANIVNSTISGNHATRFGGVFARTPLDVYNSTIAFNTSTEWTNSSGDHFGAGLHIRFPGQLNSTIIANNVNSDPAAPTPTADLTVDAGAGFNGGHNNVMFCAAACPNDTTHEDPGLHPLADNGGLTHTHVPTPGQWEIFGGNNLIGLQWDQRGPGFLRQPPTNVIDIGAYQINSDAIFSNGFN